VHLQALRDVDSAVHVNAIKHDRFHYFRQTMQSSHSWTHCGCDLKTQALMMDTVLKNSKALVNTRTAASATQSIRELCTSIEHGFAHSEVSRARECLEVPGYQRIMEKVHSLASAIFKRHKSCLCSLGRVDDFKNEAQTRAHGIYATALGKVNSPQHHTWCLSSHSQPLNQAPLMTTCQR
jgi:hypothetical protein